MALIFFYISYNRKFLIYLSLILKEQNNISPILFNFSLKISAKFSKLHTFFPQVISIGYYYILYKSSMQNSTYF